MSLHQSLYLSTKLKEKFRNDPFALVELRRHIHHLTRMPDIVVRSIIDEMIQLKLVVLQKVETRPLYTIDSNEIELKVLKLCDKTIKDLQRRYKIQNE